MAIGVLAGMLGAGPSILTVLLLTRAAGLDLREAVPTSLVVVAFTSLVSLTSYARERAVAWRPAVSFGLASVAAAFVVGHVASRVPERALVVFFVLGTLVAAAAMLVQRPLPQLGSESTARSRTTVLAASGLLVGTMTGMTGLGGGFAIVPLLVVYARTPVRSAIAAALLVKVMDAAAGLAGRLPHPGVDWRLATCVGATEAIGSLFGVWLSRRMSRTALRRSFAAVMVGAAVLMTLGRI